MELSNIVAITKNEYWRFTNMSVLLFWRGDNYHSDMSSGKAYHLNQNNELINQT